MNSDISLPTGNVVTFPVKELTPKEQLQADTLHLKGRPALVSYRENGSVISPFNSEPKRIRIHRRRTLKRKERL